MTDFSSTHTLADIHGDVSHLDVRCTDCGVSGSKLRTEPCRGKLTFTAQQAARHLFPLFLDGQFENCGDDEAQEILDGGGDARLVIEVWLRAIAGIPIRDERDIIEPIQKSV